MANFTPQEIEQMLQEFFDTVGKRQYVGARYVPVFGRHNSGDIDWNNSDAYEPLTIVYYNGDTYTSRRYVPAGIDISDTAYWVITGRYNAQIEQYRQEVLSFQGQIDDLRNDMESDYVPFPESATYSKYGAIGQVLTTLANGETKWENPVVPSDEQAEEVITAWLNAHPEATTTVQDGAITNIKIADDTIKDEKLDYVNGFLAAVYQENSMLLPATVNQTRTSNGVTYTANGRKIKVNGTATNLSFSNWCRLYELPPYAKVGDKLIVYPSGHQNVTIAIFDVDENNNVFNSNYIAGNNTAPTEHVIASGAVGILIRVQVANGLTVSNYEFEPRVITKYPNTTFDPNDLYKRAFKEANPISLANNTDLNDVIDAGIYALSSNLTYTNAPITVGFVLVFATSGMKLQLAVSSSNDKKLLKRVKFTSESTWRNWYPIYVEDIAKYFHAESTALSDGALTQAAANTATLLSDGHTYTDLPTDAGGVDFLLTIECNANHTMQLLFSFNGGNVWKRRMNGNTPPYSNVTSWTKLTGTTNTYNINNNFNTYENTYNVTATPTITTDTNNYLAATGDTTDRTSAIQALLSTNGVCNLGPGTFYVTGIVMPDGTKLCGGGKATKIRLADSVTDGAAITLGSQCTVSSLLVSGSESGDYYSNSTVGTRHGILWSGNYTQGQDYTQEKWNSFISDVFIERFSGGGITCYDTGLGIPNALLINNCYIERCSAGINISYWSEYHNFSNVKVWHCYYGCINQGGNNQFVNCGFSGNKLGFLIDNSLQDQHNNGHGSAIGCVFNHIDSNNGTAIKIINTAAGYTFDGCQIFYGAIELEDAKGIVISDCIVRIPSITITNGGITIFSNDMFSEAPTFTIAGNNLVKVNDCYVRSTGAAVTI